MRIRDIYTEAIKYCSRIWDASSNIVYVPDGTIFVETANGDGTFSPYIMNDVCCKEYKKYLISINETLPNGLSPENIEFDLDEQKCRWSKPNNTQCSASQTNDIKIVLNPVGNDGAFFTLTENDSCGLKIKFDYLFKIKCDSLLQVIKNYEAVGLTPRNTNLNVLREQEFELNSELLNINNQIENLSIQNSKLSYSIVCDKFPINIDESETTNTSEITQTQKIPFTNTGFGSLTNSTELSNSNSKKPIYQTKSVTYGLTETGLSYWRNILGDIRYLDFIDGDENSYTCTDVIQIEKLNQEELLKFSPNLIFDTTTPFGEKTKIINQISELSKKQTDIKNQLLLINEQILVVNETNVDELCSTLLGQFKSITADVTLDVIDNNNNKTQFYLQNLFSSLSNSLPTSTLYQYLVGSGDNSGFLVCGEPNTNETWASGCTGLVYPEFTNGELSVNPLSDEINVSICENIKELLYNELFVESGFPNTEIDLFNQSLSPNVFNSNWLTFEKTFDASEVTGLTNNKIVLNIVIKSSCGNLCLLVDQISLTKICSDVDRTNIFISQSPGFELTKIIDNKKSWEQANEFTERDFYIANFDDSNKIRQTEYSVDEERLILNSKEIDLTMNMASAVENDVWCYLLDNSNLLTGITIDCSSVVFNPTDIYGNQVILPTAQTYTYNVSDVILDALDYNTTCLEGFPSYEECFPVLECTPCGKALKFRTKSPSGELWVVCDTKNLNIYYITDYTDAQGTINNITYSLTGDSISNLTNLTHTINDNLNYLYPENPPYEIFWDSIGNCTLCCKECGDQKIDFTGFMSTNITEVNTLETFENLMVSELTDVKNRKVLSSYPTLRAVYDRYMNASEYGIQRSNEFDYNKMNDFTSLIKTYWDDLIEQVIPSTTMWGSIKVYTNTMFDQQKFKYRSYSSLFCNNPLNFATPPSPINGSEGQCQSVEVITQTIQTFPNETGQIKRLAQVKYDRICLTQMNWGSEFVGTVNIQDGDGNIINSNGFCDK